MGDSLFIEWDFENNHAREYKRTGDCNQCGACCRQKIYVRSTDGSTGTPLENDDPGFKNIEVEPRQDNPERNTFQFIVTLEENICPMLQESMCSIQNEKPSFCNVFPNRPEDIEKLSDCSYEFELTREWDFE